MAHQELRGDHHVLMVKSGNTDFSAEQQILRPLDDLMRPDGDKADWLNPGEFKSCTQRPIPIRA